MANNTSKKTARRDKRTAPRLPKDPWEIAKARKRKYITPEDVGLAVRRGANPTALAVAVLKAAEGRWGGAEDLSLCAFIALKRIARHVFV